MREIASLMENLESTLEHNQGLCYDQGPPRAYNRSPSHTHLWKTKRSPDARWKATPETPPISACVAAAGKCRDGTAGEGIRECVRRVGFLEEVHR